MSACEVAFQAAIELIKEKCGAEFVDCDNSFQAADELIKEHCGDGEILPTNLNDLKWLYAELNTAIQDEKQAVGYYPDLSLKLLPLLGPKWAKEALMIGRQESGHRALLAKMLWRVGEQLEKVEPGALKVDYAKMPGYGPVGEGIIHPTTADKSYRDHLEKEGRLPLQRRILATDYAHAQQRSGIIKTEEEVNALISYLL